MALIKDIEEFSKFLPINSVFVFDRIEPMIMDVQRDVFETYCGRALIQSLEQTYNTVEYTALSNANIALLGYVRPALAPIVMTRFIPIGEVQIDGRGITAFGDSESRKGADNQQIVRLRSSLLQVGMNAFERLLNFLEENISDYPDHQQILDKRPKSILPNAKIFSESYQIFDSNLTYRGLISNITRIEEDLISPILGGLYDEILENSSLTTEKSALRRKAQRALAYAVVSDAIEINMAIDLSAEGLRLNYSGEFGNLPYYKPPGDRTRETVLAAAKRKADGLAEQLTNAVNVINGSSESGYGLPDNEGSKIIMFM